MLTFFDIPCKVAGRAWSPNTWKVRYYLNFKSIPYKTHWVEFPDIEELCINRGIPPTKPPSSTSRALYTLPAIHDPEKDIYISDSARIMKYLDAKYPTSTPPAFPKGTAVLQAAFLSAFVPKVLSPLWLVILPELAQSLNPVSREYFERTRSATFGKSFEEIESDADQMLMQRNWLAFKDGLGTVNRWFDKEEGTHPGAFMTGDHPIFADFVIGATFAYIRNVWGEESERWVEVSKIHGGRWGRMVEVLRQYEQVR